MESQQVIITLKGKFTFRQVAMERTENFGEQTGQQQELNCLLI